MAKKTKKKSGGQATGKPGNRRSRGGRGRGGGRSKGAGIPDADKLMQLLEDRNAPASMEQVAELAGIKGRDPREQLQQRLGWLVREGRLIQNRRGRYCLLEKTSVITGKVSGHPDGFGFVVTEGDADDLFMAPKQMRELMDGDRVAVRIKGRDHRGRPEGSLVEVLERANATLVGRFHDDRNVGVVVPDNPRQAREVLVPGKARGQARDGQVVKVRITDYPTRHKQAVGEVVKVLGEVGEPGIESEIAISSHHLPHEFTDEVIAEAEAFGDEVKPASKRGREDLREVPLVTIDGEDARDFDDAIHAERTRNGWLLRVAIADVSQYVKPGTELDAAAWERATSVYFPDRVVPMLPETLSNGLCSLNPEVDRLALVCEMRVNQEGKVTRSKFVEAVFRSHARLTYNQVAAVLAGDKRQRQALDELVPEIEELHACFKALHRARSQRGAIDFETRESKFLFDASGKVEAIVPTQRNDAHRLIEECMIAANVEAARFLERHRIPTLYRVHDRPPSEKVAELREFLGQFGLNLGGGDDPQPKHYTRVLELARGKPEAEIVQTVLLRSMAQAVYSPDNLGHFGLALERYAHFTSPIRRYPDLLVHRAIRHLLASGDAAGFTYSKADMELAGQHCSDLSRRADEASRQVEQALKCDHMQDHVGEEFDARVTGVTDFGLFVSLEGSGVEGLVHVSTLGDDYYRFEPETRSLVGEGSGKRYRLCDPIRVRLVEVRPDERKIDFEAVSGPSVPETGHGRKRGRGRG